MVRALQCWGCEVQKGRKDFICSIFASSFCSRRLKIHRFRVAGQGISAELKPVVYQFQEILLLSTLVPILACFPLLQVSPVWMIKYSSTETLEYRLSWSSTPSTPASLWPTRTASGQSRQSTHSVWKTKSALRTLSKSFHTCWVLKVQCESYDVKLTNITNKMWSNSYDILSKMFVYCVAEIFLETSMLTC